MYTREEADVLVGEVQRENPAVHNYVLNAGLHNYFKAYTDYARFDIVSNQANESWNKVTLPWGELPRLVYMQKVEQKVASIFSKRLQQFATARQAQPLEFV